jgi:hypothetical protein
MPQPIVPGGPVVSNILPVPVSAAMWPSALSTSTIRTQHMDVLGAPLPAPTTSGHVGFSTSGVVLASGTVSSYGTNNVTEPRVALLSNMHQGGIHCRPVDDVQNVAKTVNDHEKVRSLAVMWCFVVLSQTFSLSLSLTEYGSRFCEPNTSWQCAS